MPDLQTQLRQYGHELDDRYPDVRFDEILVRLAPRRRLPTRRGVAVALAAALVILVAIGGVALLNLLGGSEPPVVTQPVQPSTTSAPPPLSGLLSWQGYWPQTSVEEIQLAQQRADEGDQAFNWQIGVEPSEGGGDAVGAEIATRYIEETLGWSHYRMVGGSGTEASMDLVFIECVPGAQNELYPTDEKGADCAPTLDELHYRTVSLRIEQLARQGSQGLWVVTSLRELTDSDDPLYQADWFSRQYEQVAPASEEELSAFVATVSEARIGGAGADEYLAYPLNPGASLVYSTTDGLSYEGFELARVDWGPMWPDGTYRVVVRMFADKGNVVVEQAFLIYQEPTGQLRLDYGLGEATENGAPVALTYGIYGGEVTFRVPEPWFSPWSLGVMDGDENIVVGGVAEASDTYFVVLGDPWIPEGLCAASGTPGSANELVDSILTNPELEVTSPTQTLIGDVDAVRLEVVSAPGVQMCPGEDAGDFAAMGIPVVRHQDNGHAWSVDEGQRMVIYLLQIPTSGTTHPLAIMVRAPSAVFDDVLAAAQPMIESFQFAGG